jgi:hypothetical protein
MVMNYKINFPALVIGESSIDKINYRYLVGDKRYMSKGYKNVLIVDILGNCFDTERVVQSGGLSLFYSIKLIGVIVRIKPVLKKPVYTILINDLRNKLIAIIEKSPKKFSALSDSHTLINEIKKCNTCADIINLF